MKAPRARSVVDRPERPFIITIAIPIPSLSGRRGGSIGSEAHRDRNLALWTCPFVRSRSYDIMLAAGGRKKQGRLSPPPKLSEDEDTTTDARTPPFVCCVPSQSIGQTARHKKPLQKWLAPHLADWQSTRPAPASPQAPTSRWRKQNIVWRKKDAGCSSLGFWTSSPAVCQQMAAASNPPLIAWRDDRLALFALRLTPPPRQSTHHHSTGRARGPGWALGVAFHLLDANITNDAPGSFNRD